MAGGRNLPRNPFWNTSARIAAAKSKCFIRQITANAFLGDSFDQFKDLFGHILEGGIQERQP